MRRMGTVQGVQEYHELHREAHVLPYLLLCIRIPDLRILTYASFVGKILKYFRVLGFVISYHLSN